MFCIILQVLNLKNQKQKTAITNGNRKPYLSTQLPPNIISENQNISKYIINSVRYIENLISINSEIYLCVNIFYLKKFILKIHSAMIIHTSTDL